jgi:hypothetical protein
VMHQPPKGQRGHSGGSSGGGNHRSNVCTRICGPGKFQGETCNGGGPYHKGGCPAFPTA